MSMVLPPVETMVLNVNGTPPCGNTTFQWQPQTEANLIIYRRMRSHIIPLG